MTPLRTTAKHRTQKGAHPAIRLSWAACGLILALAVFSAWHALAMSPSEANDLAFSLLSQSERHCAIIAVPHCGSGELAMGFWNEAGQSNLLVDAFESDLTLLASAQQMATATNLSGRNLYMRYGSLSTNAYSMPYADHFVDLVAVAGLTDADVRTLSYAEIERVMCVGGKAWIGRAAAEGGGLSTDTLTNWISGAHVLSSAAVVSDATGTWAVITKIGRLPNTYEGPCDTGYGSGVNNAGSVFYNDKLIAWPNLPQYFAKPYGVISSKGVAKVCRWGGFTSVCVGGGRMYGFDYNGAGYGSRNLCALRVQNGQLLWQRSGLTLNRTIQPYLNGLVYNNSQLIDGETGTNTTTIPLPVGTISWSAVEQDIYYAVVRTNSVNTLFAYCLTNNTTLHSNSGFADNAVSSVVISGNKIYTFWGKSVYCYNAQDGLLAWGPVTAPTSIYRIVGASVGVLLDNRTSFYFLSAADGSVLWGPKANSGQRRIDVGQSDFYNHSNEFAICPSGSGQYDLLTGEAVSPNLWYGGGSCQEAASLTPAGAYSRRGGMGFSFAKGLDLHTSDPYASSCGDAPFAASGLTIYGCKSAYCSCYSMFWGMAAESAMGAFNPEQAAVEAERLLKGPAYTNLVVQAVPDGKDWPTHRANNIHSGSTAARIATNNFVQLWKYTNPTPNAFNKDLYDDFNTYQDVTPPVTAGGYTYIAGSDGVVKCFKNDSGSNVWNYATGGWIFATPTIANGCVYVGSGDGCAYCLEAHTGRLVWRFRAAPAEHRFNYFGHLISAWPILGGVLVHTNGLAYFVSGLRDTYGVQAFAVDARTGSLTNGWQNTHCGVWLDNRPGIARIGLVPGGYMTVVGNNLWVKEHVRGFSTETQRTGIFDLQTGSLTTNDTSCVSIAENGYAFHTGRQIGLMANYVLNWGEDLHTEMDIERGGGTALYMRTDANGNMVKPFLLLNTSGGGGFKRHGAFHCPVWDNNSLFYDTFKYDVSVITQYLNNCTSMNYKNAYIISDPPRTTDPHWPVADSNPGTNQAVALTANCLVEVHQDGVIRVMDRTSGADLFTGNSGGEPYLQGMAVDRTGKIIVANRSGDVICYGTTAPVVVTPPSDVSGVDPGQSATFSVEAAGLIAGGGLTYQWYHDGMQINYATNATVAIHSVSNADAGTYYVVVTNVNGSAISSAAALSLSVAAGITAPINGTLFFERDNIDIRATATSTHGNITNVVFYQDGHMIGSASATPYSMVWSNVAAGSYTLTAVAFDDHGATGSSQPKNITVAGLAVHLPFDDGTGIRATNTSGSVNGMLVNTPGWATHSLFNGGIHFTNHSESVTLGPIPSLTNSAFTIGFWFNSDINLTDPLTLIAGKDTVSANHSMLRCGAASSHDIWLVWATTVNGVTVTSKSYIPASNTWYHTAIVATPSEVNWYINGSFFAKLTPLSGSMKTDYRNFVIGNDVTYPWGFPGIMDELKIYDRALGEGDVVAMYTNVPYRIPPTIDITSPTNNTVVTSTNSVIMTVNTTVTNYPLKVAYYQNGMLIGTNQSAPYALTWSNVPRGTYTLSAVAIDGLNQTATSSPVNVTFAPVAPPIISLAGGTYASAQTITITCSDSNALIYYTTNGMDPTMSDLSIASGQSITVGQSSLPQTIVLKVRAFENGMFPSETQMVLYRIGGALAAGSGYSTVLNSSGFWSFGVNSYGQLGDGTTIVRSRPGLVGGNLNNVVFIADGTYHSLAVKNDGTVWAWGQNNYGQLGDGTTVQRNLPIQVAGVTNAISVAGGYSHSLALMMDGTVWAWGLNGNGQLGDGTKTMRILPVQVSGLSHMTAIAAGNSYTLALKNEGTVWTWGANSYGHLGNGTKTDTNLPVQVSGLSNVIAIAEGQDHSLALTSDGTVWSWGRNSNGQLGNGRNSDTNLPVQISGLSNVIAIAGGGYHSLALKNDGTVWSWGRNFNGQLGNGMNTDTNLPVQVSGSSNVIALVGGFSHSLALDSSGNVWGWGDNSNGQLGNGTKTSTNVPTVIPETVQFAVSSQSVADNAGTATITAVLWSPSSQDVTVPFAMTGSTAIFGTDYSAITPSSPIVIKAGQTQTNLTVTLTNTPVYRGDHTLQLTMSNPTNAVLGANSNDTLTITFAGQLPVAQFSTTSLSVLENSGTVTIPVQLLPAAGLWEGVPFLVGGLGTAFQGVDYSISGTYAGFNIGTTSANITVILTNRPGIQGSRTVVLTLSSGGSYQLGATTTCTLTILDKEVSLTTQPLSATVNWGQPANFSVAATSAAPLGYQWFKNGVAISGATQALYTTPPTMVSDNSATFSVLVSNAFNCATSSVANLTVNCNQPPKVSINVPADGAQFAAPCNVGIYASVNADPNGTIQKVDFYNHGTNWLGEVTTLPSNPYGLTLNNIASGVYNLTAVVTDNQGLTATSGVVNVTVTGSYQPALAITTARALPTGAVGVAYNQVLTASGGTPGYTWSIISNSLPARLGLVPFSGAITGTPAIAATTSFTARVTDAAGSNVCGVFSLTVLSTYQKWCSQMLGTTDVSISDLLATPVHDGIANLIKYALGIDPQIRGYQDHFSCGLTNLSGQNCFALTYIRPDPAPVGVSYAFDAADDLRANAWTNTSITVNTNINGDGTVTITVHDNASGNLARFLRLLVTGSP